MTEALYAGLETAEHERWKEHRAMSAHVPGREVGFRGCLGLALLIDATTEQSWTSEGDFLFLPNDTVRWGTLIDIPKGQLQGTRREAHWASVRKARIRHGMPILARSTEGQDAWDFRAVPHDKIIAETERGRFVKRAGPSVMPPDRVQEFRVFNAVELAMTTAAFMGRRTWQPAKANAKPPAGLVCGDGDLWESPPRPSAWMPRACIGFKLEDEDTLFDLCTTVRGIRHVPDSVLLEFWRALTADPDGLLLAYRAPRAGRVKAIVRREFCGMPCVVLVLSMETGERVLRFHQSAEIRVRAGSSFGQGDILGHERLELPENFVADRPLVAIRERHLPRLFHRNLLANIRIWFDRQMFFTFEDCIHLDSRLASRAALERAVPGALMWEVSASQPFFNIGAQAFIFPPLPIHRWDAFVGVLPGDIAYDLTPPQFISPRKREKTEGANNVRGNRAGKKHRERQQPQAPVVETRAPKLTRGEKRRQRRDQAIMAQVAPKPIAALPEPEVEVEAERRHANEIADRIELRTGTPKYPDLSDEELDQVFGAEEMTQSAVLPPIETVIAVVNEKVPEAIAQELLAEMMSGTNPTWYSALCSEHIAPAKGRAKGKTLIRRAHVVSTLQAWAEGKSVEGSYADRLRPYVMDRAVDKHEVQEEPAPAIEPAPTAVEAILAAPAQVRMSRNERRRAARAAKQATEYVSGDGHAMAELRDDAWANQAKVQQNDGEPLPEAIAEDYAAMYADGGD